MRTQKEIETKIKKLIDELDWIYDPTNSFPNPYDPLVEASKIESQIYILNWVLGDKRQVLKRGERK